jgi:hypothetical protein
MRWLSAEYIGLGVLVIVGLWLVHGRGWEGFAALIAAAAILGLVVAFIGRRYPMIYSQNRRDRRRR